MQVELNQNTVFTSLLNLECYEVGDHPTIDPHTGVFKIGDGDFDFDRLAEIFEKAIELIKGGETNKKTIGIYNAFLPAIKGVKILKRNFEAEDKGLANRLDQLARANLTEFHRLPKPNEEESESEESERVDMVQPLLVENVPKKEGGIKRFFAKILCISP